MKKYITLVVAVFGIIGNIHAFPAESVDKIWPIFQESPSIQWIPHSKSHTGVILKGPPALPSFNKTDKIHFYLYVQGNLTDSFEIDMADPETLVRSPYDFRHPTSFMIHGWKDHYTLPANVLIRNALFGQNKKHNFISVDWSVYSNFENYTISQQLCSKAGKIVAQFIDWMHENAKLKFDTLTLYGHSMGAQVAGFVGKNVQRGKVHSIIGMDPALPLFPYDNPKERLADTDAEYVESIHTNGGAWGFYHPLGQTAFYPNGGKYQPGCGSDLEGSCSHWRALLLMAEALSSPKPEENKFLAVRCGQFEHVEDGNCDQYDSLIRMGDPENVHKKKGVYFLKTNSESPYARGADDVIESDAKSINRVHS